MTMAEGRREVIDLKALSAGKSSDCSLYQRKISVLVVPNQYFAQRLSQCRASNVKILRGFWNEDLFRALEGFPDLAHDVGACPAICSSVSPAARRRMTSYMPQPFIWGLSISKAPLLAIVHTLHGHVTSNITCMP
jgi:hypothetical protein